MAVALGASLLVALNAVVTRRLWQSPMYEQSQRIGQTLLLWLLPGTVFLVNWVLRGMPEKRPALDPTLNDGCTDYGKQGINVHPGGPFGTGHG
jgi:hypothetical protein